MELLLSKKDFKSYSLEIKKCKEQAGEKASECAEKVALKYIRKVPGMKDRVYPWINYDWEYDTYVDNNYNKSKTGASPDGTISALFKDSLAFEKLLKGFVLESNPNGSSKAGVSDIPKCNGDKGCELINSIRKSYDQQKKPYNDPFFNKTLDGEMSSSYYIQTGTCPRPSMDKKTCIKKGYQWVENPLYKATPSFLRPPSFISGSCYKPKYSYIKNKSGLHLHVPKTTIKGPDKGIDIMNKNMDKLKGAIPSLMDDIISLSPNNIYDAMNKKETPYISNMECIEPFNIELKTYSWTNNEYLLFYILILIFTFIIIILLVPKFCQPF